MLVLRASLRSYVALKYFLVQRLGSALFLRSILISTYLYSRVSRYLMITSLILKLGIRPLHGWLLHLAEELNWGSFFLINSTQKVIPFMCALQVHSVFTRGFVLLRLLTRVRGALWELSLKKVLVYSSILGGRWFLISCRAVLSFSYLTAYSLRFWLLSSILRSERGAGLNISQRGLPLTRVLILRFSLINFRGLPPCRLFYIKLSILGEIQHIALRLVILLLLSAAVFIFIYLRIIFSQLRLAREKGSLKERRFFTQGVLIVALLLRAPLLLILRVDLSFDLSSNKEIYYM